jgi:hypothetical protein
MVAHRVGGALMRFMGHSRWGYGKKSRRVEGSLLVIPNLRWDMALKLDFGMTRDMENPSRKLF